MALRMALKRLWRAVLLLSHAQLHILRPVGADRAAACWPGGVEDFRRCCVGITSQQESLQAVQCPDAMTCCCVFPTALTERVVLQIRVLQLGLGAACGVVSMLRIAGQAWLRHQCAQSASGLCFRGAESGSSLETSDLDGLCMPEAGAALTVATLFACPAFINFNSGQPSGADQQSDEPLRLRMGLLDELLQSTRWSQLVASSWGLFIIWALAVHPKSDRFNCFAPGLRHGLLAATALRDSAGERTCMQHAASLAVFASLEVDSKSRDELLDAAQQSALSCGGSLVELLEAHHGPPIPILAALALAGCYRLKTELHHSVADSWQQGDGLPAMLLGSDDFADRIRLRALVFESIYKFRAWTPQPGSTDEKETLSGSGSALQNTRRIRGCLAQWIRRHRIRSLIDLGCGDARWQAGIRGIGSSFDYLGMDISATALLRAAARPENAALLRSGFAFQHRDPALGLPMRSDGTGWDLALTQDVLQHLSEVDILQIVYSLHASKVSFFAATHHFRCNRTPADVQSGGDTAIVPNYSYRWLDLYGPPFFFPPPLEEVADLNFNRIFSIWRVADLPRGSHACFGNGAGGLSYERCCDERLGPQGNLNCWSAKRDDAMSFDRCCRPPEPSAEAKCWARRRLE